MVFLRKLLFPFSLLYAGITALRNVLYNRGLLQSKAYKIPIICVGNLSTGGTGKTPMIELLVSYLMPHQKVAILSRGYKRTTTGYREVFVDSTAKEVGDEPLQFKNKFPNLTVAVCEDRPTGIEKLMQNNGAILLDDAFQHRKVKASFNILLTAYGSLYVDDCVLPAGNLREPKAGAGRADCIVVTKCPETISHSEMDKIRLRLKPRPHQEIFFSKIGYATEIKNKMESKSLSFLRGRPFHLVTGIAKPQPLIAFLKSEGLDFTWKAFPDHHNFTEAEMEALQKYPLVLTTEKDFMRLLPLAKKTELFYLPIKTVLLQNEAVKFKAQILRKTKLEM
jgi:tetraacyldisaccharide 4'-kinase